MPEPRVPSVPVYVLGAGFSHAISPTLPLTTELGNEVAALTDEDVADIAQSGGFERHLTQLMTSMPFLQSHENTSRSARAERMIAAIATVLDQRVEGATSSTAPAWLSTLIALWHAERAVVITLNYDTLVELAINASRLATGRGTDSALPLDGARVVDPSPALNQVTSYGSHAPPASDSLRLIKVHGSLNWYWSVGEPASASRHYVRRAYGDPLDEGNGHRSPVTSLDRLLIPPTSTKDSYYRSSLNQQLWRTAHSAIRGASSLTLLGYSLPREDTVVASLIKSFSTELDTRVADIEPGTTSDPTTIAGRLHDLGLTVARTWGGEKAIQDFVESRFDIAVRLADSRRVAEENPQSHVLIRLVNDNRETVSFLGMWISNNELRVEAIPRSLDSPPLEALHQDVAVSGAELDDFVRGETLLTLLSRDKSLEFDFQERRYALVGVRLGTFSKWKVLYAECAPLPRALPADPTSTT